MPWTVRRPATEVAGSSPDKIPFGDSPLPAQRPGCLVLPGVASRRGLNRHLPDSASAAPLLGPRHAWRTTRVADTVLRWVPDGLLLDAGCGPGTVAVRLAVSGRVVLALDVAPERLRETRQLARKAGVEGRVLVFLADAGALPLVADALAGATAGEVLEHVADDRAAARELARVLRPGGALVVTVPAGPDRLGPVDRAAGHWRRYDGAALVELLTGAGLHVEELTGWGWPFGRIYDRMVQRPALAARGSTLGGWLSWAGRRPAMVAVWRWLFDLESHWDAGERGSGWLAVGRKGPD